MSENLSEEELEILREHRAKKARQAGRKVRIKGKHEDSGAEYEFDLEGDEAERVISRHKGLWADEEDNDESNADSEGDASANGNSSRRRASSGPNPAGEGRKAPTYFGRK